jgi:tetratricopeptide (TPR) repeat protein
MTLAGNLKKEGKFQEAIDACAQALKYFQLHFKTDNVTIARVYERMGECHLRLGDKESARQCYKDAYKIWGQDETMNERKKKGSEFSNLIKKYISALPSEKKEKKINLIEEYVLIMQWHKKDNKNIGIYKGNILIKHFIQQINKYELTFRNARPASSRT